jgi:hypothetical protein
MIARLPWKRGDYVGVYYVRGRCEQGKDGCFAYDRGKCLILSRSDFTRDCPFFKTAEQYEKDLKKYPIHIYAGKDKYDFD